MVSFVVTGEVRGPMMMILNWASLFVVLVYSTAILVFLKTCLRFNSPDKLLAMISEQYQAELRYDDMKLAFKKLQDFVIKRSFGGRKDGSRLESSLFAHLISFITIKQEQTMETD